MADEKTFLQVPALGRPFALGTLYDANKSKIIPGISLCKHYEPNRRSADVDTRPNITCLTFMTSKDSLESKMDKLDIKGSLKLNILANTVEIQGTGKYLSHTKTSKTQANVVLISRCTTRDEFLLINKNLTENVERNQELIKQVGATHVVVGIAYGYELLLVLQKSCTSEEEKMIIEGQMAVKVASWIPVSGDVRGHGLKEGTHEKKLSELTVMMYGNVQTPTNPTSFEEAMEIYRKVPEFAENKDCPLTVYLLPLAYLCSSVSTKCSQVSQAALSSITAIFESISNTEVALSGIQNTDIAATEPRIRRKAKQLSTSLNEHKIWLQTKLDDIMNEPEVTRGSSVSEHILEIIEKHEKSPFSTKVLDICVSQMEKEVHFMEGLVTLFRRGYEDSNSGGGADKTDRKTTIDISSDEISVATPFDKQKVFVLELPIIAEEDDLLKEMQNYNHENDKRSELCKAESLTLPFEEKNMQRTILKYAKVFLHLAGSNTDATFRCVFQSYGDDRHPEINTYSESTGDSERIDPDIYIKTKMQQSV